MSAADWADAIVAAGNARGRAYAVREARESKLSRWANSVPAKPELYRAPSPRMVARWPVEIAALLNAMARVAS